MRTTEGQPVRLEDYAPTPYQVEEVALVFRLDPAATEVEATVRFSRRAGTPAGTPLVLDGDGLTLVAAALDGAPLGAGSYGATADAFRLAAPPAEPFCLTLTTRIDPSANTQLMGLYRSNGNYCTQCEAEGFRRITYFYDRPDVLAPYTVRIEARAADAPVLLSNGNPVEAGQLPGGRHFRVWRDPFPKPAYLFALVAGTLGVVEDTFTTRSGRDVALQIYVEPGKEPRASYAMDALKRSMRWDEKAFGREYDLDIFMIVAVSDFNMGAMENKGLNIFNDRYVLADPETATDQDHAGIEAVIAHEYFHNWTGNRITCRDWFQLCLKEGLTVFRDQEFTADERSRAVKRITDVKMLRTQQFPEDAGPLAHPVRPAIYHEISNFYTATVYEKGAEVIRALKTLIGADAFRRGMDLYFDRHDGEAVTIEAFLACFAEAAGADLSGFMRWYVQAGTPRLVADEDWDGAAGRYTLTFRQSVPDTPGQTGKAPMTIPVRFALLSPDGAEAGAAAHGEGARIREDVIVVDAATATVAFEGLATRPVASLLRGFSAPVILSGSAVTGHEPFLLAHDRDPFNRWQAGQNLARAYLTAHARDDAAADEPARLVDGLAAVVADPALESAFKALMLQMPPEADIINALAGDVDPDRVRGALDRLKEAIGRDLGKALAAAYRDHATPGPYRPDAASAGARSLRNTALDLLVAAGQPDAGALALAHFEAAGNMTERVAGLSVLVHHGLPEARTALAAFHDRYRNEPLVLDKWFAVQATAPGAATLDAVAALTEHPGFTMQNPNRVRALIGAFAQMNPTAFNRADGEGYRFVAARVLELDKRNPQVAARLLSAFRTFRMMEPGRRAAAQAALEGIAGTANLSSDTGDIVRRMLA